MLIMDCVEKIFADVEKSIDTLFYADPRGEELAEKIRQIFRYHLPDLLHEMLERVLTPNNN